MLDSPATPSKRTHSSHSMHILDPSEDTGDGWQSSAGGRGHAGDSEKGQYAGEQRQRGVGVGSAYSDTDEPRSDQEEDLDGHPSYADGDDGDGDGDDGDQDADSSMAPGVFPERPQGIATARRNARRRRSAWGQAWQISKEALPTLILSLLSLMFSGELLVHLARWPVFLKVDKLFILVPILLNLKGNLEMNLSLRMSTSANIGELDIRRTRETLIVGNMTLLQVQALIVSSGAGVLAFLLGVAADRHGDVKAPVSPAPAVTTGGPAALLSARRPMTASLQGLFSRRRLQPKQNSQPALQPRRVIHSHPKPVDPTQRLRNGYFEFVLVLATAMLSASLSSAILGNFMCALVVVARRTGANPDNIASPLAASLGDLLTLTIVGLLGSALVRFEGTILATLIFLGLLAACAICFFFTLRNTYVRELLSSGWVPLILAMFISSGAGLVLDTFVQRFEGFALLAPVVTGLPGACAAILVSRTSTALHSGKGDIHLPSSSSSSSSPNGLAHDAVGYSAVYGDPAQSRRRGENPRGVTSRLKHGIGALIALIRRPVEGWLVPMTVLTIGVSIELLFLLIVWVSGQLTFRWPFMLAFAVIGVFTQVAFALVLAHVFTLTLWSKNYDPDIYCLPLVSSLCDVAGQALLVLSYAVAHAMGDVVTAAVGAHADVVAVGPGAVNATTAAAVSAARTVVAQAF
ncbi:unnamed protein product [Parajaminaea phylloscopi]